MKIEWEEPPPIEEEPTVPPREAFLAQLKVNPGKWAVWTRDAGARQSHWWAKQGCEVRFAKNPKSPPHGHSRWMVYVRWTGAAPPPTPEADVP